MERLRVLASIPIAGIGYPKGNLNGFRDATSQCQSVIMIQPIDLLALTHLEELLEVGAAGGEDDLVRREVPAAAAGQRHVHEVLLLAQPPERRHQRRLVVGPPQTVRSGGSLGRAVSKCTVNTNCRVTHLLGKNLLLTWI